LKRLIAQKLWIPLLLVMVVAVSLLFASPTTAFFSSHPSSSSAEILRNGYLPPGELIIQKVDKLTGETVAIAGPPWVTFKISPNPYDLLSSDPLGVKDNGVNDHDSAYGIILLKDVPVGTYEITEIVAPPGYQVNREPFSANVNPGKRSKVFCYDLPIQLLPAYSHFGMWFLVGGFAILIVFFILWKNRHNIMSGLGGAGH
jgi:hypothetical protein